MTQTVGLPLRHFSQGQDSLRRLTRLFFFSFSLSLFLSPTTTRPSESESVLLGPRPRGPTLRRLGKSQRDAQKSDKVRLTQNKPNFRPFTRGTAGSVEAARGAGVHYKVAVPPAELRRSRDATDRKDSTAQTARVSPASVKFDRGAKPLPLKCKT